jgi:hypothetical protein
MKWYRCWARWSASEGQALVIVAASLTVLISILALAVDAGNLWVQRTTLQTVADAAALAGAQQFVVQGPVTGGPEIDETLGPQDATAYVVGHGLPCPGGTPECVVTFPVVEYGSDERQYIQVALERIVPLGFARVFGFREAMITAAATARVVRVGYSGDAVIGFSSISHSLANGMSTSEFVIRGGLLSWVDISGLSSGGHVRLEQGVANAGRNIISPNIHPEGQEGFAPLADPYQEAISAGQLTLPAHPGPVTCQTFVMPPPDPADPKAVVSVPTAPPGTGWDVLVTKDRRVVLERGRYCRVEVVGSLFFRDTTGKSPYFIEQLIARKEPPESPQVQMDFRIADTASPLPVNYGALIVILNQVALSGSTESTMSHFELKGDPTRQDLVFYIPPNAETYVPSTTIDIDTIEPSNLVGSIYAPVSDVSILGNPDPNCLTAGSPAGARVTRGGSLTKKGGRVVADRVQLRVYSPSPNHYPSCGVDYPPITKDFAFLPTLAPPRP